MVSELSENGEILLLSVHPFKQTKDVPLEERVQRGVGFQTLR